MASSGRLVSAADRASRSAFTFKRCRPLVAGDHRLSGHPGVRL